MQNLVKRGLTILVLMIMSAMFSPVLMAQEYPTKPVNLIIPFGPGGGHDLSARAITPVASKYLGKQIILHHKPGGGGAIAASEVARAKPDGYTLLLGGIGPNCALPAIEKGRGAGPDDIAGVCQVIGYPEVIVSRANAPFKNLKQMVEYAKANPDKMVYATSGPWGIIDIVAKSLIQKTGMTARIAHFDGGGPAMLAVLGGHADVTDCTPYSGSAQIKAGKLIPMAVLDYQRHPAYPDVPTAREQGIDLVFFPWISVNAPKGTPPEIIKKLSLAFKNMIDDQATREISKKTGIEPRYLGTEEFVKGWRAQYEEFQKLANIYK